MERSYPILSNGMPVRVDELELKPSHLRDIPQNISLHHYHFPQARREKLLITETVGDLEGEHERMFNDQHNLGRFALHALYGPPKMATLSQYMDRLDQARQTGEHIERRVQGFGWVALNISNITWKQIDMEYERLR